MTLRFLLFFGLWLAALGTLAQDPPDSVGPMPRPTIPYLYFPLAPEPGTITGSLGAIFTISPSDLTEELTLAVPAVDLNLVKGVSRYVYITGRGSFQFLQNHVALGAHYARPLGPRITMSAGADVAGWAGRIRLASFDEGGYGALLYPHVSVGVRAERDLLFTLKAEGVTSLFYRSRVGGVIDVRRQIVFDGVGLTLAMEQPFFGGKHLGIGVQMLYTDFNWQFRALYETFDRKILYPSLILSFFL